MVAMAVARSWARRRHKTLGNRPCTFVTRIASHHHCCWLKHGHSMKWIHGYGNRLVWNSMMSTLRAPAVLECLASPGSIHVLVVHLKRSSCTVFTHHRSGAIWSALERISLAAIRSALFMLPSFSINDTQTDGEHAELTAGGGILRGSRRHGNNKFLSVLQVSNPHGEATATKLQVASWEATRAIVHMFVFVRQTNYMTC